MSEVIDKPNEKEMILNGNLWKVMWTLSWSTILGMVLYGMNTVLDAVFVGRFVGETALAGVSIVHPLTIFYMGFGMFIGSGSGALLSILIGANDKVKQERLIGNANYLMIICSIVMTLLGVILAPQIVYMMGGRGESGSEGIEYFRTTAYFTFFWVYAIVGELIVRAGGKVKVAALIMGIGMIINIIFNYIFLAIFEFGVAGAAWGTNIGMAVTTFLFMAYIHNANTSFKSNVFSVHRDKDIVRQILSLGFPSMIISLMTVVQGLVVFNVFSEFGTDSDVALYGLLIRIASLMLTPIHGLTLALQPALGINFGAKQYERIISFFKVFALTGLFFILPFWFLMEINPGLVLYAMLPEAVFTSTDIFYSRLYILLIVTLPIVFTTFTMFPAINKPRPVSILGAARQLVFYVPLMLILPRFFGIRWVYIGSMLIDIVMIVWVIILVIREFGKLKRGEVNLVTPQ